MKTGYLYIARDFTKAIITTEKLSLKNGQNVEACACVGLQQERVLIAPFTLAPFCIQGMY